MTSQTVNGETTTYTWDAQIRLHNIHQIPRHKPPRLRVIIPSAEMVQISFTLQFAFIFC
ncbi:MAG: hypothetical protein GDA44_10615 [Prochloron sp. SP5CPC1]|nr:hypothetical protein [Candidatus Paraprochloron terpiosi SP5CPC1]